MAMVWSVLRRLVWALSATVLVGLTLLAGLAGGFFGSLRLFEEYAPPPAAHTLPARPQAPPADLSREKLDALLEGEAPPTAPAATPAAPAPAAPPGEPAAAAEALGAPPKLTPGAALSRAVASVRLHRPIESAALQPLDCDQLSLVRNWVWAGRGYVFTSDEGKAQFSKATGYQPDANVTLASVEESLEAVDQANRNALMAALKGNSCRCGEASATQPCPE